MKHKYDFFRILPALAFIMGFYSDFLLGQISEHKRHINFMLTAKTSDKLYINDSIYFLMNKSPLEQFADYKKLYDDMVNRYGDYDVIWGSAIPPDKTSSYNVEWYLNDSLLYLSDINPNVSFDKIEEAFPNNEQYKRMEELTGVKFDTVHENHTRYTYKEYKYDKSVRSILFNPLGAMPATWFSDTIIVKRALQYWRKENINEWEKKPCRELIFKNGRLVSDRIKEGIY